MRYPSPLATAVLLPNTSAMDSSTLFTISR